MNFISFEQLNDCIYKNLHKVPRDIDLIVGIPRSGMLPATILALYLNLPFVDIDSFLSGTIYQTGNTRKCENWIKCAKDAKKILVIDDSISTGKAIQQAKEQIKQSNIDCEIYFCAIYALSLNFFMVDVFFEVCNHPRMFEWNYMHHWGLKYSCVDIDGVLCRDPNFYENDDGEKYIKFIRNALPKFLPTKPIGYIVSARLEKYRNETEKWLQKYNIKYDNLIMLNCENSKERIKSVNQGEFKANVYKNSDCFLFIESNLEQAVEICKLSHKQVFCTANRRLINPNNLNNYVQILLNDWRITLKRVIKKILKKI
ncbi:MAG: phosphoribosyltransferase family protein [Clostridia bacterium]|nr:phosphoribosyltransferase family protein [Clostridia bacterium]